MVKFFVALFLTCSFAFAQVGEVVSLKGASDGHLIRGGQELPLTEGASLELGDTVNSGSGHVMLLVYPKIQISLVKETELTITSHMVEELEGKEKSSSLFSLLKGLVRLQVTRDPGDEIDQRVDAKGVIFAVRGTEYEVSSNDEEADLDVIEGEVEVSSPYVQTLVPEIVRPKQGFRFNRKAKSFARREMRERNREARFLRREAIRQRWQQRKAQRKERRGELKERRGEQKTQRHERRLERRQRKGRRGR